MILTINQFCQTWWSEVFKKVKMSVVFIDDVSAECLHWSGSLIDFYNAGALAVKEFSSFESGDVLQKKAVFITSGYGDNLNVLKNIIENSKFEYCILITSAHPSVLQHEKNISGDLTIDNNDMKVFVQLENDMLSWMKNMNYTVEILYMPLFLIPVTDFLFLTPPFFNLFPTITPPTQSYTESPFGLLTSDLQITLKHIVTSFHSLFNTMDSKEDIYSLGDFSAIVAGLLENLPAAVNRRKVASNSCTLILVDRTLDVCSASSFSSESLLDRIISVLPRFPGHQTDVAVNMSLICEANVENVLDDISLAPGCLAHNYNLQNKDVLQSLILNSQKNILNHLHVCLSEIKSGHVIRSPPRITHQSIEKLLSGFKGNYDDIEANSALLQQSLAVVQTLKSSKISQIELLMSIEKLALQNLATSKEATSVLTQISQIIKNRKHKGLNLENLLCLLLHVYSLAGTDIKFSNAQEKFLEVALEDALYEDKSLGNTILNNIVPETASLDDCKALSHLIMTKLKSLTIARKSLSKYKSVLHSPSPQQPAEYKGIVEQLIHDLLHPSKPDMIDLASRSSGIKDLLKSSLSLLMNKPKQQVHPIDNSLVIVFVIGGITAQEVRIVEEAVRKNGVTNTVLVGSTKLVNPIDVMQSVLTF